RDRAEPGRRGKRRRRCRGQTTHFIQRRGSRPRSERAQTPPRDDSELVRPVNASNALSPGCAKRDRTSPRSQISGGTPLPRGVGVLAGGVEPGLESARVGGQGG